MSKLDNHVDEQILREVLIALYRSPLPADFSKIPEEDILTAKRVKTCLDQYYADFYRNKILEARVEQCDADYSGVIKVIQEKKDNPDLAWHEITNPILDNKKAITAQFNSKEGE